MNKKKYLIIILFSICIIFIAMLYRGEDKNEITIASETSLSLEPYIFLTKWGSKGSEDGEFGSLPLSSANIFKITDETIEKLKYEGWYKITKETIEKLPNEIDKDKLTGLINIVFLKEAKIKVRLNELNFAQEEIQIILDSAKNTISEEKLEILQSLKNQEIKREEIAFTLEEANFNSQELHLCLDDSGVIKQEDLIGQGPLDIAVDKSGNVYVTDFYNDCIQKFYSEGNFIIKWGIEGKWAGTDDPDGLFNHPWGSAVDSEEYIYIADSCNKRIQKFDSEGNFITKWGGFEFPVTITTDSEGNVYVNDFCKSIHKFDSEGNFITKWLFTIGEIKSNILVSGPTLCKFGDALAVDSKGYILAVCLRKTRIITDPENPIIVEPGVLRYSTTGEFIDRWTSISDQDGQIIRPKEITIDSEGNIFVITYEEENCIQKFDPEGNFIYKWGKKGSGDGEFLYPEAIAVNREGNVYVLDTCNYRIQKFAPNPDYKPKNSNKEE